MIKPKKLALFLSLIMLSLSFVGAIGARGWRRWRWKREPIIEGVAWFDHRRMCVCWRADLTNGQFWVDLDGDHSTAFLSGGMRWHEDYGNCVSLGVVVWRVGWWSYGWASTIGELKIDRNVEPPFWKWHIQKTRLGDLTEWFGVTIQRKRPPTDWVVKLYASNGTHFLPIIDTFWYTTDSGATWHSLTP